MDIVGTFVASASQHDETAPALAFVAGIAGSIGPCLGARAASLVGLTAGVGGVRRRVLVAAFVAGLVSSYVLIASSAALWLGIGTQSSWIYCALALGLFAYGVRALVRSDTHGSCNESSPKPMVTSIGCTFLSGASFALVASPCCTPILVAIAGIAARAPTPLFGIAVASAFAIGHGLPLMLLACWDARLCGPLRGEAWRRAASVIGGGVTVALAGYYALLV